MIIPTYWAEARLQHRDRKRQVTVRRFGWSDTSEADAQAHADLRARDAFDRVLAGEALPRRERRVAYNGAEGVPIREEIVDRHGDAVITRNGYGALCLNTPDVLFADIDFEDGPNRYWVLPSMAIVASLTAIAASIRLESSPLVTMAVALAIGLMFGYYPASLAHRTWTALRGGHERQALRRVEAFLRSRPQWRAAVYRTPAGVRLMALHRLFDPREPDVQASFDALGVDPVYARMCRNQNCFRARISPKPWRMGLQRLRPPYSAVWRPEHAALPARQQWIADYGRESQAYASCRYLDTLGDGGIDPQADALRQLHDAFCRADQPLTIA